MDSYYNCDTYNELPQTIKDAVLKWIELAMQPADNVWQRDSSYGFKHMFERSIPSGAPYLTEGQFKGAMLASGYEPIEFDEDSWMFRVKPRSHLRVYSPKHREGYGYKHDRYCVCYLTNEELMRYEFMVIKANQVHEQVLSKVREDAQHAATIEKPDNPSVSDDGLDIMLENFNNLMKFLKACQRKGVTFHPCVGQVTNVMDITYMGILSKPERQIVEDFKFIILKMIHRGDIDVCPMPNEHRWSWYYGELHVFKCEACQHILSRQYNA